jgi:ABC-type nitrate/sulfonate/bicarbonate transport system ATPase subunit
VTAVPKVRLAGIIKDFDSRQGRVAAIDRVDLEVEPGQLVSIVGPSGCGKTTLFNITAGLLAPSAGEIFIDGEPMAPGTRGHVAYMLQKDLLLPWRTVLDNIILGLELRGRTKAQARKLAVPMLGRFGLSGFENRHPSELSGGMRQRAALMRTVLTEPDVLLLDEPFGALDAQTRPLMQEWLLAIKAEFEMTVLLVTHDVDEAVLLSDVVYVLTARPGRAKARIEIAVPKPRTLDQTVHPAFVEAKRTILALLRDESRLAFDQSTHDG